MNASCKRAQRSQHDQHEQGANHARDRDPYEQQSAMLGSCRWRARLTKLDEASGEPRIGAQPGAGVAASGTAAKSYVRGAGLDATAKSVIAVTRAGRRVQPADKRGALLF